MVFGRTGLSGSKVVKCRVAEYFPEKSRLCLVKQVCQEVKWLNVGWLNTSQRSRDGVW